MARKLPKKPDPDLVAFRGIENTKLGYDFRRAWQDAENAVATIRSQIKKDLAAGDVQQTPALRLWRLNYITATEVCSRVLTQLEDKFKWPPEARHEPTWVYQPPPPVKRTVSRAPKPPSKA